MSPAHALERAQIKAGALQDAIFNSAYFSSIATDEHGVIQIFNVGAERMLGYAAVDVVNQITPADISDPQELLTRAAALSRELDTTITPGFEALVFKASRGIEDIYELTYIRKDGSRFPAMVSVTALRDAQDSIIGYLLIGTDNTVRREVEAAQSLLDQQLRDQQFYTRSLIESGVDPLMTTDATGTITDVNQQMIALTGSDRAELIGAPCRDFFTDPVRADEAIERVLTEHRVTDYELTVRAKDGQETVVSYNAATFHDNGNNLQGVIAVARDVTERKHIERTLQEKNIELEHANRMKSEFLATMSHELRTPLNAVIGFSEALKDGLMGEMPEAQHQAIGDIFTSGEHLLSLINDILDLSKVEAGMMTFELEEVDLVQLLSNALSIVRDKAAARHVRLELDVAPDLGTAQLDSRKTKQIIYNLLSNAVKFSDHGGRVVVRARRVPRAAVGTIEGAWPVRAFPLADNEFSEFVEISVADTGMGISEQDTAKLFQAFSQIDSSLARKFEGTGLGLAMVKQMTELLGGTVAVASAVAAGSRFAAWLPLRAGGAASTVEQDVQEVVRPAQAPVTERVALVVEDDERAGDLVALLLEAEGFRVVRAESAEVGLQVAAQHELSLISLDVQLPGMSGWEFLETIRDDAALAQVPVVIISGAAEGNIAVKRGAAAILHKPILRADLTASLVNLGLHASAEQTRTVLVVDDDPTAVELIATFLPTPGYAVVRAYGGSEAILLAQRVHPDLILLDLMMPDVSGFDVVDALQRDTGTATIPILVVTAKQVTNEDRVALNPDSQKVIHIMQKAGFNRQEFMAEVRRALP